MVVAASMAASLAACSSDEAPASLGSAPVTTVAGAGSDASGSVAVSDDATVTTDATTGPAGTGGGEAAGRSTTTTTVAVPSTSATVETVSTTTIAPATTTTLPSPEQVLATVQGFVGGTPGVADPVNGTVVIGWVNQEGGTPSFSDATTGLAAAASFVNQRLGGIGGRVIELRTCAIQRVADGARCAQLLRDDPAVSVVLVGAVTLGNQELLDGLEGAKPVVLANPLTTPDYLADDAVAYTPGSPGIIAGLARFATEGLASGPPAKAAVVYPFGLAGEAAYQLLAKPVFDRAGIPVVPVAVIEGSDPTAYAAVIQGAGAADAAVFLPILGSRGCIGLEQAIRDLASTASVLATDACLGASMSSWVTSRGGTGPLPEGWYLGGSGFRFGIGPDPAQEAYLQIVGEYLATNALTVIDATGFAATSFATLLTVVKVLNGLPPEGRTPEAIREATRGYTGSMWGIVGSMQCGFNPFYPTLCGTQMGVQRAQGGVIVPWADGYTGGAIDLTALTAPAG